MSQNCTAPCLEVSSSCPDFVHLPTRSRDATARSCIRVSVFATTTVLPRFMAGLALGALISAAATPPASRCTLMRSRAGIGSVLCDATVLAARAAVRLSFRTFTGQPVLLTAARTILASAVLIVRPASWARPSR